MIKKMKIPEERIAVIIGYHGTTRREIEKVTKTKISIDDDITVTGESLDIMTAENVIRAISRGFSPRNALALVDEEFTLSLIELPKNERVLMRIRSRLIGTRGKSRRNLEILTKTRISIYGRTVGIIGVYKNVELAEDAITRIIKGHSHKQVYEYLERRQDGEATE